jgi:hypothetical protein
MPVAEAEASNHQLEQGDNWGLAMHIHAQAFEARDRGERHLLTAPVPGSGIFMLPLPGAVGAAF